MSELTWAQLWRAAASNLGAAVKREAASYLGPASHQGAAVARDSFLPGSNFLPGSSDIHGSNNGELSTRQQLLTWAQQWRVVCPAAASYLGAAVASRLPGSSFSPRTFTSLCTLRTLSTLPRRASTPRFSRSSWLLARRSSRRSSSFRLHRI